MSAAATGKVQRPGLITRGGSSLLRLSWKLFMLPVSITGSIAGLITGSVGLAFRVAAGVLSYSVTMIRLTTSGRPDTSSVSAASEAIESSTKFENRHKESTRYLPVSIPDSTTASEAIDFLLEFEMQYGKMHPNFVPESLRDAVEQSRHELKLLFVYLHAPDHPDTRLFCKETLCSETLSAFVNENFVAWGYSVTANGGLKMRKSLNSSRFPFCTVITAAMGQSVSLLRQFGGPASPEEMLAELRTVLDASTAACDAAYRSAPEADQAKEDQNQLEKEGESARLCEAKALFLGPEPEIGPDVTHVLVRLPNGERKGRRFHCNATLQSVYDFVDSAGCLDVGSYTLVTFFPRVFYGEDEFSSTIEELGLYPHASLFVELKT